MCIRDRYGGRALEQLLLYFKALCDQQRVNIVSLLLEREHCVCELVEKLDLSQSTVSHLSLIHI